MNQNNFRNGLGTLWLISLAMVLGTAIVVLIPITISGGEAIKASDWIGFAGNVVSGAMTLFAATIAWFAVGRQIVANEAAVQFREREVLHVMKMELIETIYAVNLVWERSELALEEGISEEKREFRFSTAIASFSFLPEENFIGTLRRQSEGLSPSNELMFSNVLMMLESSLTFRATLRLPETDDEKWVERERRVIANALRFCLSFADVVDHFDPDNSRIIFAARTRREDEKSIMDQIVDISAKWDQEEPE